MLLSPRFAVVISPLISLMDDQVQGLTSRGVKAVAVHSSMSREDVSNAMTHALEGRYALLYMSPEFAMASEAWLRAAGSATKVSLIAIDESHCTLGRATWWLLVARESGTPTPRRPSLPPCRVCSLRRRCPFVATPRRRKRVGPGLSKGLLRAGALAGLAASGARGRPHRHRLGPSVQRHHREPQGPLPLPIYFKLYQSPYLCFLFSGCLRGGSVECLKP